MNNGKVRNIWSHTLEVEPWMVSAAEEIVKLSDQSSVEYVSRLIAVLAQEAKSK